MEKPKGDSFRFNRKKVFRKDSSQKGLFSKNSSDLQSNEICGICGKPNITGYVKIKTTVKGLVCDHERPVVYRDPQLTQGEEKRISEKLKPNEVAVKGEDGIIRIIER